MKEKKICRVPDRINDPNLDHGTCEQRKPNNMIHKTKTKSNMYVF